jgi:O-glycosyl hydrolase
MSDMYVCPYCGSAEIYDMWYAYGDIGGCKDCGATWEESYLMTPMANFTDEDYDALDREDEGNEFW